jgi:hypothetical protein
VTPSHSTFAQPDKDPPGHAPYTRRESPAPTRPLPHDSSSLDVLQRTIGNQAVQRLVSVQRTNGWIRIGTGEKPETVSPASLANKYCTQNATADFTRARDACKIIDQQDEGFDTEAAAFQRVTAIMAERAGRAATKIVLETDTGKIAGEMDYYAKDIDPQLKLTLVETYPTSYDKTGGWGAEYVPSDTENNAARWVIHVHRGPNGGIKWARVKPVATRKLRGPDSGGATVMNVGNLAKFGVQGVDPTKKH